MLCQFLQSGIPTTPERIICRLYIYFQFTSRSTSGSGGSMS